MHIDRSLSLVKSYGLKCGLAFNPTTPLSYLDYVMDKVDVILLMSVNPGFGGQLFIPEILKKIHAVRHKIDAYGRDIILEVDGGIKVDNIKQIADAGVEAFVAGSAIFNTADYSHTITSLRENISMAQK